jgi:hypothetical protein
MPLGQFLPSQSSAQTAVGVPPMSAVMHVGSAVPPGEGSQSVAGVVQSIVVQNPAATS